MWKGCNSKIACLCGTGCLLFLMTRVGLRESWDDGDDGDVGEPTIAIRCIDFHSTAYAFWDVFDGC